MRLAIIFDNFGPYHHARVLALAERCEVCSIQVNASARDYRWGTIPDRQTPVHTLCSSDGIAPAPAVDYVALLRRRFEIERPHVIAVPGWHAAVSIAAIRCAIDARVPVIMMSESTRSDSPRRAFREFAKRQILALCSGAIVGGTPHVEYVESLGLPRSAIVDGYDVVDNNHFAEGAVAARSASSGIREELRLPQRFFLASSRFIKRKNLRRLIAAYDLYRRTHGQGVWGLVILGYGPEEEALRGQVAARDLGNHVQIRGFVPYESLPIYYGLAEAFVHPALSEPWGLVVNEAMAAGLPVLVSNTVGCAHDLVRDGETGFTFDPSATRQIADCFARLANDSSLRHRLAKGARRHIAAWTPARFGDNLSRLALEVTGRPYVTPPRLWRLWLDTIRMAS